MFGTDDTGKNGVLLVSRRRFKQALANEKMKGQT